MLREGDWSHVQYMTAVVLYIEDIEAFQYCPLKQSL
jgi:hypothetical protein